MSEYKRIDQLKIPVHMLEEHHIEYVTWAEVDAALKANGMDFELFGKYFGCQTCLDRGPYPWDVEAVLERMMSGRKTGTQDPLLWD